MEGKSHAAGDIPMYDSVSAADFRLGAHDYNGRFQGDEKVKIKKKKRYVDHR